MVLSGEKIRISAPKNDWKMGGFLIDLPHYVVYDFIATPTNRQFRVHHAEEKKGHRALAQYPLFGNSNSWFLPVLDNLRDKGFVK